MSGNSLEATVLMSVYAKDDADHFDLALRSLDAQTFQGFSIVLVQDGPIPEAVSTVLRRWQTHWGNRLQVIELRENQGLARALAAGLEAVKTELVARFDADDYCVPERLERQVAYMVEHPDVDVLGSAISEFTGRPEDVWGIRAVPEAAGEIRRRLWLRNPMNHMTVVFRRSVVMRAGGYLDFRYLEDYYLWARLIAQGARFANLATPLVLVRTSLETYRRRGGWQQLKNEIRLRYWMWRAGLMSRWQLVLASLLQIPLRLLPPSLRVILWRLSRRRGSAHS